MNSYFSFRRFAKVLKRDLIENQWNYVRAALRMCMAWILIFFFCLSCVIESSDSQYIFNKVVTEWFCVTFLCGSLVMAAVFLYLMNDKKKRICYLMLPATSLEKYISRLLIGWIGGMLLYGVAFIAMDIVRVLLQSVFHYKQSVAGFSFWDVLSIFFGANDMLVFTSIGHLWATLAFWGWFGTLYIVGGSIWYKSVVLKVTGLVVFIFLLCFKPLAGMFFDVEITPVIVFCLFVSFSVLNLYVGYRCFKHSSLIDRKLFRL